MHTIIFYYGYYHLQCSVVLRLQLKIHFISEYIIQVKNVLSISSAYKITFSTYQFCFFVCSSPISNIAIQLLKRN